MTDNTKPYQPQYPLFGATWGGTAKEEKRFDYRDSDFVEIGQVIGRLLCEKEALQAKYDAVQVERDIARQARDTNAGLLEEARKQLENERTSRRLEAVQDITDSVLSAYCEPALVEAAVAESEKRTSGRRKKASKP